MSDCFVSFQKCRFVIVDVMSENLFSLLDSYGCSWLEVKNIILFEYAGIEDLCNKRDELNKAVLEEEEEKKKIQNDIKILTERLAKINESLSKKMASRNEFDKTIAETEAAYMKVHVWSL